MRLSSKTFSRMNTKSFFVAFVISVGVISFIVTGVNFNSSPMDATTAARVGSQTVSVRRLSEVVQQLNTQSGSDLDDSRRRANMDSALSQLIQEKVLVEEAVRMGFSPNDLEVAEWIRRIPDFQDPTTKKFDKALYQKFVKSGQLSELELFNRGRDALAQEKIYTALQLAPYLPSEIVADTAKRDAMEFEVEFVELKIDENRLKSETEAEAKKVAEDPTNEAKLRSAYEASKAEFSQKAGVRVNSILVAHKDAERAEGEALQRTEAEAKKLAEDLLARAKKGENFETLASTQNDDTRAKAMKGDLGWVDSGTLDADSSKAAFALTQQQPYSEVVKTPFGFRIFQLKEQRPAVEKSFEDVKLELARRDVSPPVRARLENELEKEVTEKLAEAERAKLPEVLAKHNLAWKKVSKPITANSRYVEELGMMDTAIGAIFGLKNPGDVTTSPVDVGGRKMLFKLVSKKEGPAPTESQLSQVRRIQQNRAVQSFVSESSRILVDVYNRNKEIHRNESLLSSR